MIEYTFISRNTFNEIIENYITNLPLSKREKALINLDFLNRIKQILFCQNKFNKREKQKTNLIKIFNAKKGKKQKFSEK